MAKTTDRFAPRHDRNGHGAATPFPRQGKARSEGPSGVQGCSLGTRFFPVGKKHSVFCFFSETASAAGRGR